MDSLFELLFGGESSALALIAGGLVFLLLLALVFVLLKRRGVEKARRQAMERIRQQQHSVMGSVPTAGTETKPAEIFTESGAAKDQIEVNEEVDPLAEVAIYLEYGYYERAAETLRWFADEAGQADLPVLRKLLEIYLQLGRMDDYADILERLCLAGDKPDFLRQAIAAGLREDYDNLQIRVVAETHLQLGVEDIEALIGPRAEEAAKPAEPVKAEPEALELAERKAREQVAVEQPAPAPAATATRPKLALIKGSQPLAPLDDDEKQVLRAFSSPALEAKLSLASNDRESALTALRRAVAAQPKAIAHYVDILKLLYFKHNIDDYSHTLWQLHLALGNAGRDLKERLLGIGFVLGHHPVLESLAQARETREIEAIGKEHRLFPTEPAVEKRRPLVEAANAGSLLGSMGGHGQNTILAEVDAYLEYGQLDEALALLENSVLEHPDEVSLYLPLLDLYDRMDALARFTRLASEIKKKIQRPPDEVIPLMTQLYQRLNKRRQEAA